MPYVQQNNLDFILYMATSDRLKLGSCKIYDMITMPGDYPDLIDLYTCMLRQL